MYKRYRDSLPLGYKGTSVSLSKPEKREERYPSENNEVFPLYGYNHHKPFDILREDIKCSAPQGSSFSCSSSGEYHSKDRSDDFAVPKDDSCIYSEDSHNECENGSGICEVSCEDKKKSEGFLSNIFGEKFSLEDLIFIGILILLVSGKADDEIMLIIGLLLLISS